MNLWMSSCWSATLLALFSLTPVCRQSAAFTPTTVLRLSRTSQQHQQQQGRRGQWTIPRAAAAASGVSPAIEDHPIATSSTSTLDDATKETEDNDALFSAYANDTLPPSAVSSVIKPSEPGPPILGSPFLRTLWDFTRPHTLIGSALCIPALHLFAWPLGASVPLQPLLMSIFWATLPALLMNVYITGLNQVTDIEIDAINKPYLPIPSRRLSRRAAVIVVASSLALSLAVGFGCPYSTGGLRWTLVGSMLLGTIYSLPPFRLKRFPLLAALCIIAVRGALVNLGFYAHATQGVYAPWFTDAPHATVLGTLLQDSGCLLTTLFFTWFGVLIALMKDIPDVQGDRAFDIASFSVRFGQRQMFRLTSGGLIGLLAAAGVSLLASAGRALPSALPVHPFPSPSIAAMVRWLAPSLSRAAVAVAALGLALTTWRRAAAVDSRCSSDVYRFYMFMWTIFYASYCLLPLTR
ncbi:unnamed protein product [Vitrella brassicaformis CCMP3155]|uniref:Homogentisate phytyltransferase n=2 Tax=Vitrella brassicaformis TaxID=1169539 RepID=A0A0G4EWJ8_VITBC|nr:unnamed protein product [Vitrella brassicaformis CCMP3155]|eukprot:CEM03342.1 unnamed protein product [Vitrella brassicaformis CCMP3155]